MLFATVAGMLGVFAHRFADPLGPVVVVAGLVAWIRLRQRGRPASRFAVADLGAVSVLLVAGMLNASITG